jgi:hypothetical protein
MHPEWLEMAAVWLAGRMPSRAGKMPALPDPL